MPLIEAVPKGKTFRLEVELDRDTHAALNKYLRFSRADKHRVVSGALQMLFRQDTEFEAWLKERPTRKRGARGGAQADTRSESPGSAGASDDTKGDG